MYITVILIKLEVHRLSTNETLEPVSLRLPSALSSMIRNRAKANRRSFNQETIVLLERIVAENEKAEAAVSAATPA